jgi:hypothetical protein
VHVRHLPPVQPRGPRRDMLFTSPNPDGARLAARSSGASPSEPGPGQDAVPSQSHAASSTQERMGETACADPTIYMLFVFVVLKTKMP